MASRKTVGRRARPQRATSNIFAMFDQAQIQEFKEAFNMIDQDHDGFISNQDLQVGGDFKSVWGYLDQNLVQATLGRVHIFKLWCFVA
jgi:hypothetical protein